MAIYLIRHGETPGNRDRVVQRADTPLSGRGLEQAGQLAARLADHRIERILASDLSRAHMTAQRLAEATGVPVQSEPLLQERNLGDLRGTPYAELDLNPFAPGYAPPGGETWEVFHRRVDLAWERIRAAAKGLEGHLAVVTHGLVLHSLAIRHLELPADVPSAPEDGPPLRFGNTALSIVQDAAPWRIELFACTAHLTASGGGGGGEGEGAPI
jgi:broad specificity phosphatase PhoE